MRGEPDYKTGPADEAGLLLEGRFGAIEIDPSGRLCSLLLVRGTELCCGSFRLKANREIALSVTFNGRQAQLVSSPSVGFETLEGVPVYRNGPGHHGIDDYPRTMVINGGRHPKDRSRARTNEGWPRVGGRRMVISRGERSAFLGGLLVWSRAEKTHDKSFKIG